MDFSKLNDERNKLVADMDKAVTAGVEAGKLSAEDKAEFTKAEARVKEIDGLLELAKAHAKAKFEAGKVEESKFDAKPINVITSKRDEKAEFANYLRSGRSEFATGSSGFPITNAVQAPVEVRRNTNKIREALALMGVSPIRTDGGSIQIPLVDDSANVAGAQTETATSGTAQDATFSSLTGIAGGSTLLPNLYTSKQEWYANTLINANGFDITSYVLGRHYKRLDRFQENTWMTKLMAGTVGVQTAGSSSAITYDEWIGFVTSLAIEYRDDAVIFLSDLGYQYVRKVKDSNGRPLLDLDPTQGVMKLDGKPVLLSGALDNVAGVNKIIGVIASVDALKVYDAGNDRVKVYQDNPAYPDQQGYEIFRNGDFAFVANGVRTLKTKAT